MFSGITSFISKYLVIGLSITLAVIVAGFVAYWYYSQGKIESLGSQLSVANETIAIQKDTIKTMNENISKQALLNDQFNQLMGTINSTYSQDINGIDSLTFDPVDSNSLSLSLSLKTNNMFHDIENIAKSHQVTNNAPTQEKK